MYYSFTLDTSRQRLEEALESFAVMCEPSLHDAAPLSVAMDRMKTHEKEIEAISLTLRIQGVHQDDFTTALPLLTPDKVFALISQETPTSTIDVRCFGG